MRNELPEVCFSTLPDRGDLIIIKRGEAGYRISDWSTGDKKTNQALADVQNHKRGITPAQVQAMEIGSMYGFDVPGTNPQSFYDEAVYAKSYRLGSNVTISHPKRAAVSAVIRGNLFLYYIAKKKCFYIEPQSMPEILLSKQSNIILLPDMVSGRPLIPVITQSGANGAWSIELDTNSFSSEKEVIADYRIIAKVHVGPVEYAMGQINANVPFFATWERTPANDGDGPPNYYWGHYFDSREKAVHDFCKRAVGKYKMLYPDHKPSVIKQLMAKPVPGDKPAEKSKDREVR